MTRSFTELSRMASFEQRFRYLSLQGQVAEETFGWDRWINQRFYASRQWKDARSIVIARDLGCDLGIRGMEIPGRIYIHHMNPMRIQDITHADESILDPEFLITTSHAVHNAIHYGAEGHLPRSFVERKPGDTTLW